MMGSEMDLEDDTLFGILKDVDKNPDCSRKSFFFSLFSYQFCIHLTSSTVLPCRCMYPWYLCIFTQTIHFLLIICIHILHVIYIYDLSKIRLTMIYYLTKLMLFSQSMNNLLEKACFYKPVNFFKINECILRGFSWNLLVNLKDRSLFVSSNHV